MKVLYGILITPLVLIFASCSSITVKTDFDRDADFSQYKKYRWASGTEINPDDELARNPLLQKRIMSGIDQVLGEKGFILVDNNEADFIVMVHAGIKEKMQVTDWGNRGWYDPWWGPYGGRVDVSYYEEVTLVIDVVNMPKKELIWRGLATGIVRDTDPDPDEQEERIYNVVSRILNDFPPKR
jgi:hypothetical protein